MVPKELLELGDMVSKEVLEPGVMVLEEVLEPGVMKNQIQLVGTNYGGMVAFRMVEMYPNFVKKVVISNSGVGFMSTSLDELLARSNLSSISKVMSRE
ncbi:unnamed protein product [Sphagnum compactum]